MTEAFRSAARVCKVDQKLGLVFGFAVVCKQDGAEYVDLDNESVPEDVMLKAATDFMQHSRLAKEMHGARDGQGEVLYAFPLTEEIAKSLGIKSDTYGLLIGMKPDAATLAKFADGTYTGFSIGGMATFEDVAA